ncbi:V-type ATP synthase subunit F [ANME-1 cluster archaeon ex4572_4]|nr:MAG: V-type ATP synthase subunit F [ANME-1 cluster archaeon ex4572_4]
MIAVIGDPETATGFRLAGVKAVFECSAGAGAGAGTGAGAGSDGGEEVARVLERLARDGGEGNGGLRIIVITERLAAETKAREKIKEINARKKGVIPIIIEVPDKKGPLAKEIDEIGWLIKRAVGVAVK